MAESKTANTGTKTATKDTSKASTRSGGAKSKGFSEAEREAMRERAEELRAEQSRGKRGSKASGEQDLFEKVAEMAEPDRVMAERLHEVIMEAAPGLTPKTWYGMPAYAKDGKVVCFFQGAAKFQARYATLGFNDSAKLDDGTMWPTAFALKNLTPANEKKIAALVKQAVSEATR